MDKGANMTISGFLLIFGTLAIGIELINDFDDPKILYSLFYPEKYLKADCLIDTEHEAAGRSSCEGCYDMYYGSLEKYKIKTSVKARNSYSYEYCKKGVPVWYCTLTKTAIWRTGETYNSPFEFESRNYLFNTIGLIIYLPNLLYYLYLKFKK
jgi:hypothetical protein